MAELKFTIPDARMPELVEAWAQGYIDVLPDGATPNPQTKAAFAKEQIKQTIIMRVKQYQAMSGEDFPIT